MSDILIVYPHNFLEQNMGTNIRIYGICKTLKDQGHQLDLLAFNNLGSNFSNFNETNSEGIIRNLYLTDFKFITRIVNKIKLEIGYKPLGSWVTLNLKKFFKNILKSNNYTHLIFVYPYTADLLSIKEVNNINKVFLMEDFMSMNRYMINTRKNFGKLLNDEYKRLKHFDRIVCISMDELLFFQKLIPRKKYTWLPYYAPTNHKINVKKEIDVIFIGHDNIHNIRGINYFINEIVPQLNKPIRIVICGKVSDHILGDFPFIEKIGYVENAQEIIKKSKVSICPLITGTGMKVKVVESMSYGIPVVCTSRGIDGFPDKFNNGCLVTDNPNEFAVNINRLLSDDQFYNQIKAKTIDYFNSNFSEEANKTIINNIVC